MNVILSARMLEATRLTREGRLMEASALLQNALGRAVVPDTASSKPMAADAQDGGRPRRIVDIDPETGDALDPAPTPATFVLPQAAGRWPAGNPDKDAASQMPSSLREFLGQLAPGGLAPGRGRRAPGPMAWAPEPLPDGARFERRRFSNPAGNRDYKLYIPSNHHRDPVPLLVMLHGCTQSPDDFAAGTRMNALAEEHGWLIAYPEQTTGANAQKCWNWFSPADQQRDQGEPALIAGITRHIMREHVIDPRRVYVAGLSAGGAAAAIMAQAYPDVYAAVGVHSGLPCGAASDIPTAFAAMRQGAASTHRRGMIDERRFQVPTIVFHADKDTTVHPRNGDLVAEQVGDMGAIRVETHTGQVPGGHAYSRTIHVTPTGETVLEQWLVHGAGHAWSGGSGRGSYTDPRGPDASREMVRFFLQHARRE